MSGNGAQKAEVGDWIEVYLPIIYVPDDHGNSPDPEDNWESAEVVSVDADGRPTEVRLKKNGQLYPMLNHLTLRRWRRITS